MTSSEVVGQGTHAMGMPRARSYRKADDERRMKVMTHAMGMPRARSHSAVGRRISLTLLAGSLPKPAVPFKKLY